MWYLWGQQFLLAVYIDTWYYNWTLSFEPMRGSTCKQQVFKMTSSSNTFWKPKPYSAWRPVLTRQQVLLRYYCFPAFSTERYLWSITRSLAILKIMRHFLYPYVFRRPVLTKKQVLITILLLSRFPNRTRANKFFTTTDHIDTTVAHFLTLPEGSRYLWTKGSHHSINGRNTTEAHVHTYPEGCDTCGQVLTDY